jgi:hypothetical protein
MRRFEIFVVGSNKIAVGIQYFVTLTFQITALYSLTAFTRLMKNDINLLLFNFLISNKRRTHFQLKILR